MWNRRALFACLLAVTLLVAFPACKKKVIEDPPPPPPPPVQQEEPVQKVEPAPAPKPAPAPAPAPAPKPSMEKINQQFALNKIYFEFDQSGLSDSARRTIQGNADLLKETDFNVKIEGHCDERGSIEYNLALGERRANAVRSYMTSLGINASRVRIVSYGEERPAEQGRMESAWSKNRRAEFVAEPGR